MSCLLFDERAQVVLLSSPGANLPAQPAALTYFVSFAEELYFICITF
jgi:hypothetical protein